MAYRQIDYPWRRNYEAISTFVWFCSLLYLTYYVFKGELIHLATGIVATSFVAAAFVYNLNQCLVLWNRKLNLHRSPITFLSPKQVKKITAKATKNRTMFLGYGFHWTQRHTQLLTEIKKVDKDLLDIPSVFRLFHRPPNPDDDMGEPYIHGVGIEQEDEIHTPLKHLEGHTLIAGTTGCGKTVTMRMLITCAVLQGHAVIIVDPKGDSDLLNATKEACDIAGRSDDFMFFHPAHPSKSGRIDPLRNWTRETGIASRIAPLIPSETGADAFVAFCWNAINTIALGLISIGVRPNLKRIKAYIEGGPEDLLYKVLEGHFRKHVTNWEQHIRPYIQEALQNKFGKLQNPTAPKELLGFIAFYKLYLCDKDPGKYKSEDIDSLISMVEHSREHFMKMIASLTPLLTMLTSGELGDLLSPNVEDMSDPRPITDSAKAINKGQVLYIGTDSLSDSTVGAAIGSICLSDITATAGDRYNYGVDENRKISIFIDEAAEVINDTTIALLNKGRGAGFTAYIATQTFSDFCARLGSEEKARMVMGNLNNLIAMRSKDRTTQDFIVETFGQATVYETQHSTATTALDKSSPIGSFSGGYGERLTEKSDADLISADTLGRLPNLHFIASVSGGRIFKGRVPIIQAEKKASIDDLPWVKKVA